MRRRIYLLNIALMLALANLIVLPITAGSLVPVVGVQRNEGCGCSSATVPYHMNTPTRIDSLVPLQTGGSCSGCTKLYNTVQVWCNLNIICSSPPLKVRKLVRNKCYYNCGDGKVWVWCPNNWQPTYDCCSDSSQFRWTPPPCDDPGETMCSDVTPGSC